MNESSSSKNVRNLEIGRLPNLGGDGKAWGHREADLAHLRKVGSLAAKERLHGCVSVAAVLGKGVDIHLRLAHVEKAATKALLQSSIAQLQDRLPRGIEKEKGGKRGGGLEEEGQDRDVQSALIRRKKKKGVRQRGKWKGA